MTSATDIARGMQSATDIGAEIDDQIHRMLAEISLEEVKRVQAEKSLYEFVKQAWHIIESKPFVDGPHIRAICDHLEAVVRGRIRKLLVNVPPRTCKSRLTSIFLPAWVWTTMPTKKFFYASYSDTLALDHSMHCRRIIESQWYQNNWRRVIRRDQNTKHHFALELGGERKIATISGGATGFGADYLIVDDPHNVTDAFSTAKLEAALRWFTESWTTRQDDPKSGAFIVIMQRVSEKDISAHCMKLGGWEHLCLPMEYDRSRHCRTSIGWEDWRRRDGELLWPERIDAAALAEFKTTMGRYAIAGQFQQTPAPRGGGMFSRANFKVIKAAPVVGMTCRYWDRSFTDDAGDWTVGFKLRKSAAGLYYILHIARFQTSAFGTEERIKNIATSDGLEVAQVLEEDPAAGKSEAAYLVRALSRHNVRTVKKRTNKEVAAVPAACQVEAGNVFVVEGAWNEPFFDEVDWFPRGAHDDQIDGFSGAFNYLNEAAEIWFAVS